MERYRNLVRILTGILLLALPALVIRVVAHHNQDIHMLPLAPDNRGQAAIFEGRERQGFTRIDVRVDWPSDWSGTMTQARLRDTIANTLKHQTELYYIDFQDQPGDQIGVTFVVGPNRYGPFTPEQMVDGIGTALVALRMTNGPESF